MNAAATYRIATCTAAGEILEIDDCEMTADEAARYAATFFTKTATPNVFNNDGGFVTLVEYA